MNDNISNSIHLVFDSFFVVDSCDVVRRGGSLQETLFNLYFETISRDDYCYI